MNSTATLCVQLDIARIRPLPIGAPRDGMNQMDVETQFVQLCFKLTMCIYINSTPEKHKE
jgi:hypothetical protein